MIHIADLGGFVDKSWISMTHKNKGAKKMKSTINNWRLVIIFCLTLGLAPFFPEPHIWGKIKWIAGGGVGMQLLDWFDFVYHGLPWVLLLRLVVLKVNTKFIVKKEVA
ncbi:hypothetical protein P872_15300 [Rhodonellum psychrophilum GCM71 = DSM 17998]|uniref:RND transporter n=2 Tax=Rhodonellum TaxID=336827 RepID=U5C247_9BACT|nr:hypothetical protein P872_15300 [Rhodonellum psychrophilum GCM71 = DSM 17998]